MSIYDFRKQFEYNLTTISKFEAKIIEKLLTESEKFWKLLKYNTYDALSKDDLTMDEKLALIEYEPENGEEQKPFKRIAFQTGQTITGEHTEIRIYPFGFNFTNEHFIANSMRFELMAHYNLQLVKGGRRLIIMMQEIIKATNKIDYSDVKGLTDSATFDNTDARFEFFNTNYSGYTLEIRGDMK